MSSLDFWKQVKESRETLKKNKANYQTLTISDGIFNMLYKDAERKEKLEKAWEIVKNINANHLRHIKNSISYSDYMEWYGIACEKDKCNLSEEQWNLLKEMLEEK